MRLSARSLAITAAGAVALVGLSVVPASAATAYAVTSVSPDPYNIASASSAVTVSGTVDQDLFGSCAAPSVAVHLTSGGTTLPDVNAPVNSSCAWSASFTASAVGTLPDGTVTATATKPSGIFGPGPSTSKTFTKDTTAPAAPVITAIPGSGTNGTINSTTSANITAAGTGEAKASVSLKLGSLTRTATVLDNGNWSMTLDQSTLADGTYSASATQTDPQGNTSAAGTFSVVKDTHAPTLSSSSPSTNTTVASPSTVTMTFSDALRSSSSIVVKNSGGTEVSGTSAVSSKTITWTRSAPLTSGRYTATASAFDVAGNQVTPSVTFTVDATAPAVTNLKSTNTGTGISSPTPNTTVTGTLSEAATLKVVSKDSAGHAATKTISVGAAGNFSAAYSESALNNGTVTVTVTATDKFGNSSTTSNTHTRTVPPCIVCIKVPSYAVVGGNLTITGVIHHAKAGSYGTVTLVHTSLSGRTSIINNSPIHVSSTGTFSFTYRPTTGGKYYAIYNGDPNNPDSPQSDPASSELRLAVSASTTAGAHTAKAVISGVDRYPTVGSKVSVYKLVGATWVKIGTATVTSNYRYTFSVVLPKGSTKIRVWAPPSRGYAGSAVTITATRT